MYIYNVYCKHRKKNCTKIRTKSRRGEVGNDPTVSPTVMGSIPTEMKM